MWDINEILFFLRPLYMEYDVQISAATLHGPIFNDSAA